MKRRNDKEGKYVVYLCRECHEWVESNPVLAKEEGLEISSYDTIEYKQKYEKPIDS